MDKDNAISLTVRGAEKSDAGRGIARLPESARQQLGVLSGDTVLIIGSRETVAKVWPANGSVSESIVLVDADTRTNADVTIGDTVRIHPIGVDDARSVTLSMPPDVSFADEDRAVELIKRALRDRPIQADGQIRFESVSDKPFVVTETRPEGQVRVTDTTTLRLTRRGQSSTDDRVFSTSTGTQRGRTGNETTNDNQDDTSTTPVSTSDSIDNESSVAKSPTVTYEDIGGLDDELELVREMIELPLSAPTVFTHLGVDPPKGVLLHGPPGTGKTLIAKAVANEVDATFINISGPEIMSKYKGESEEQLREKFEMAREEAPSIVFFDEIDSIAPARDDGGDVENRIVGQLLSLMDGLDARGDVVVVGATNRIDTLDPALRRGGRFDREIEIGVPDEKGRREILAVHTRQMPLADNIDLDRLAAQTHGFVGADLESLSTEAAMAALRRGRRDDDAAETLTSLSVTREDMMDAMAAVDPSAIREYVAESPTTTFDDVGGLDAAKQTLERAVIWPLTYGPLFDSVNTDPPTGALLYGPPGTGKTLLARAIAGEAEINFVEVAGPELLDRYVGESEKAVREVFERARQAAPAIIFFDEIDAVAANRAGGGTDSGVGDRVVSQLLTELDRITDHPNLVVLAATNRRDTIDSALLRPGRLESHIAVPRPDAAARRAILEIHLAGKPLADNIDRDELVGKTAGYVGADIEAMVRDASVRAIESVTTEYDGATANEHADEIVLTRSHFETALDSIEPTENRGEDSTMHDNGDDIY
ncbi:AAA family ATPase [Haloquadratum walsbyi]|jgi:transitional endoplasmic reticulum ATPase|uniref:AAA-type ATPase (CDC48 subfamily) n=1 Tax=Haloquadratum walsbyi (strain DSM 16790 / HBSQ001) TaxID=362976 RepID=Q18GN6_HALWD|nr:AAA family ATPase [Haloquadratum walsbyi]CAJ52861.1 AAA-type ATPase (CDC48 subfamily) [Haloquadratum walsbyi DSM 16790]